MAIEVPVSLAFWPSTTRILADFGFYDHLEAAGPANREVGLKRGSAVDRAVTYLAMGREPEWTEQARDFLEPYTDGFRKFLRGHSWRHDSHQNEFVCRAERFISHPDLLGTLDDHNPQLAVLEVKTGAFPQFVRLQTAGQIIAEGNRSRRRYCINLPGDGSYKLTHLTDPSDFSAFTILVRAWWVKAQYQGVK
jgi:hypothetical protein